MLAVFSAAVPVTLEPICSDKYFTWSYAVSPASFGFAVAIENGVRIRESPITFVSAHFNGFFV
ncbi:hypothetical protein MK805_14740 [Shimazuella sp. AN120528]|uniref:hypothetical protein n=1 Tax=Shimazuella soli TaxID=1892854 RepID=UPI001F0CE01E|nr:hypothetical protein [Shimazuella soli]MCH5586197.1 hypothetical protein [Shimazuella soli]